MPNYFYVINTGTRTASTDTPYSTQQTSSFPANSNCYASIVDALSTSKTTDPAHGDFICAADSHSHNYATSGNIDGPITAGSGIMILSVDVNNCENYKRGAAESSTSGAINFDGYISVLGVDFSSGDDHTIDGDDELLFYDCSFTVAGFGDIALNLSGSCHLKIINSTININHASAECIDGPGDYFVKFINCTFSTTASFADDVVKGFAGAQQQVMEFIGCDFSGLSSTYLVDGTDWDGAGDEPTQFAFRGCKIPSLTGWVRNAPVNFGHEFLATNTSDTSAAAEYQFYYENGMGTVEDDTTFYRDGSTAFPSGQKTSLKVISDANAGAARAFSFEIPVRYAELSSVNTDTIRVYLLSATSIDDGDVWCEVVYPDGTNKHTPNYLLSVTDAFDPFRTPGSLDTNTEAWTGRTSENRYHIDLDTSGDAGADCVPTIRVYVAKASTTIYFCPTLGLS